MTENVELYDNKCRILCIKLTIMDAPTLWCGFPEKSNFLLYIHVSDFSKCGFPEKLSFLLNPPD